MRLPTASVPRWWPAASRTMAVTLGAYCAAALLTMALPLLLEPWGVVRLEAVVAASLASFLFFGVLAICAALARTAARAWALLVLVSIPALAVVLFLG